MIKRNAQLLDIKGKVQPKMKMFLLVNTKDDILKNFGNHVRCTTTGCH